MSLERMLSDKRKDTANASIEARPKTSSQNERLNRKTFNHKKES